MGKWGIVKDKQSCTLLKMVKVKWTCLAGSSPWEGCALCQVIQQRGRPLGASSSGVRELSHAGFPIWGPSEEFSDEPTADSALRHPKRGG